ncbi:MAG: SpoIIE family protein phosphatase, partial [Thalassolituus oleivorans]|nr:SpoIIE family protein phosphatase [Thalassolituus oleivorans]
LFPEAEYLDYEMVLPENFNLLLFSDGILEIMKESSLNDKEASLLRLTSASKGGLEQLSNLLGLNEDLEVPDDIAMASISRGKL